jgi:hypothetical protein
LSPLLGVDFSPAVARGFGRHVPFKPIRKVLHCSSVAKWQSGWPNPPEEEIAHQAYTGSARTGAAVTEIATVVATAVTRRQANDVFMPDDRC